MHPSHPAADALDMQGKSVLITGASSGIGLAMAKALAACGARLLMVCRDEERGSRAWNEVIEAATCAAPLLFYADLSSQAQVRTLAEELCLRFTRLDVLINNAGGIYSERSLTADGIERSLATNHLAPFLLTLLVLDLLRQAPGARIVNVTSEIHADAIDLDDLQCERGYGFMRAYRLSKLANILFTYELARRLEGSGVTANCFSPGPTRTRFGDNMDGLPRLFPLLFKRVPFLFRSPEQGADTGVHLAASPELAGVTGRYFMRRVAARSKPVSYDKAVASRLWEASARLVYPALRATPAGDDGLVHRPVPGPSLPLAGQLP